MGQKKHGKKLKYEKHNKTERRRTALHEAGHAVVCLTLLPDWVVRLKISRRPVEQPNGRHASGWLTTYSPYNVTREDSTHDLAVMYGGCASEELFCGKTTNGFFTDVKVATKKAIYIVEVFGLPDRPLISFDAMFEAGLYGPSMNEIVAPEVERLLDEAHKQARSIIKRRKKLVEAIADALLKKGRLNRDELLKLNKKYK